MLPTSGAERDYLPGMFPRRKGNCYSFALDKVTMDHKLQPGELAGDDDGPDASSSCKALGKLMTEDARATGKMYKASAKAPCRKGYYKIGSVLDPGEDYHFYRQMRDVTFTPSPGRTDREIAGAFGVPQKNIVRRRDGRVTVRHAGAWAHKRGLATGALIFDACGKPIRDPRKACRDYGDLDYRKFCDFWCVLHPSGSASTRRPRPRATRRTPAKRSSDRRTRAGRSRRR